MSMSDLFPSGPARPARGLPVRELMLGALAWNAVYLRTEIGFCADCTRAIDGLCPDHRDDSAHADDLQAVYNILTACETDRGALILASGVAG